MQHIYLKPILLSALLSSFLPVIRDGQYIAGSILEVFFLQTTYDLPLSSPSMTCYSKAGFGNKIWLARRANNTNSRQLIRVNSKYFELIIIAEKKELPAELSI